MVEDFFAVWLNPAIFRYEPFSHCVVAFSCWNLALIRTVDPDSGRKSAIVLEVNGVDRFGFLSQSYGDSGRE